jgi:hypothetical protein
MLVSVPPSSVRIENADTLNIRLDLSARRERPRCRRTTE